MKNNPKGDTNEDYNFARCHYCGFPLDKSRDKTVKTAQITYSDYAGRNTYDPYDFTIGAGCPFCGCPQPYDK
jgi:hypothetical protein